jgi:hypothetical protein
LHNFCSRTKFEKARTKRAERIELTQDWVVDELRKIAAANMLDYAALVRAGSRLQAH